MTALIKKEYGKAPEPHEMQVFKVMANAAAESKMYRGVGDINAILMIMLTARELDIPPCQAINGGINVINGKIELSARLIASLIWRAGHEIDVIESTPEICILKGYRYKDGKITRGRQVQYTLEEARKAGLVKPNSGWTKNPEDMLFARAMSRLGRQLFPDVVWMGYAHEEIPQSNNHQHKELDEEKIEESIDVSDGVRVVSIESLNMPKDDSLPCDD